MVYTYDNKNELVEAEHHLTSTSTIDWSATYKYDAFSNRIETDIDSDGAGIGSPVVTKFVLDGWKASNGHLAGNDNWDVLADLNSGGSLETRYLRGDVTDQLFAELAYNGSSFTPSWTLTDIRGSVRNVIDNSATSQDSINYDAFGNILAGETHPGNRGSYAWTGRQLDVETGLQYNRARYYDSTTGRWMTQDPLGFDAGDSNLYRYVNNQADGCHGPKRVRATSTTTTGSTTSVHNCRQRFVFVTGFKRRINNCFFKYHSYGQKTADGKTTAYGPGVYLEYSGKGCSDVRWVQYFTACC